MKRFVIELIGLLLCFSFVSLKADLYIYGPGGTRLSFQSLTSVSQPIRDSSFNTIGARLPFKQDFSTFSFRLVHGGRSYSINLIPNVDYVNYDVYRAGSGVVARAFELEMPDGKKVPKSLKQFGKAVPYKRIDLGFTTSTQADIKNETKSNIFVQLIGYDGKATAWSTIKPLEKEAFNIVNQKDFIVKDHDGTKSTRISLSGPGTIMKISLHPKEEPLFGYRNYYRDAKGASKRTEFNYAKAEQPKKEVPNQKESVQFSNHTLAPIYIQIGGQRYKINQVNKWGKPGKKLLTVHSGQNVVVYNHNLTHMGYIEKPAGAKDWLTCEIHAAHRVGLPKIQKFVIK